MMDGFLLFIVIREFVTNEYLIITGNHCIVVKIISDLILITEGNTFSDETWSPNDKNGVGHHHGHLSSHAF